MQLEEIQIPVYFGGFIDVFWDSDGIIRVDTERDRLSICANGPALAALAKRCCIFRATIPFVMLMCIMILSFARTAMSESP